MRAVHRKRGDVIAKKATIIAVTNQKGGVGKSTTCENLGIGLAMEGKKILLVDTCLLYTSSQLEQAKQRAKCSLDAFTERRNGVSCICLAILFVILGIGINL